MSTLAVDDFDRTASTLGTNWDIPASGTFHADGDRAVTDDVPASGYWAIFNNARPANTLGINATYSVKVRRSDERAGTFEAGLIMCSVSNANWSTPPGGAATTTRKLVQCVYESSGNSIKLQERDFAGTQTTRLASGVTWNVGDFHEIKVRIRPDLAVPSRGIFDVFFDGTPLGIANIYLGGLSGVPADQNYAGLFCFRTPDQSSPGGILSPVPPGSQRPEVGKFDLFKISDNSVSGTIETEPSCAADPTLASIAISGEGTSAATLTIQPDSSYVVDRAYVTNRLKMTSPQVVRHPRLSQARRFWRMTWTGRNTTTKDSLVSTFDALKGAVGVFTWTPPGGSATTMAPLPDGLTVTPNQTESIWDLELLTVETF